MTPEICPSCGADVPERAKACPECGADERTGWSDDAKYQSLGLPDDSFDYDEFVEREFDPKKGREAAGLKPVWKIVAAALTAMLLYFLVSNFL